MVTFNQSWMLALKINAAKVIIKAKMQSIISRRTIEADSFRTTLNCLLLFELPCWLTKMDNIEKNAAIKIERKTKMFSAALFDTKETWTNAKANKIGTPQ